MERWFAARLLIWPLLGMVPVFAGAANADDFVHGLWVWKSPEVLKEPGSSEALLRFCKSQGINEVYVSVAAVPHTLTVSDEKPITHLIALLHRSNIRVEALLSSVDADEPGEHRDKLLGRVHGIVQFNQQHAGERFDGIHLDVEPHQRPENKGPGNLRFLRDLVGTYQAVSALARPAGMMVNADIPIKYLKAEMEERRMLLAAVPRLTLMLYEISDPGDGQSMQQKIEKLQKASQQALQMAYRNLGTTGLARIGIGLRTPDYDHLIEGMLETLDKTLGGNPHYLGWARHSYNDTLTHSR
jgi:hypothetical protein